MSSNPAADIRAMLLEAAGLSLDKLPMLRIIFDRMATFCANGLRQFAEPQTYYSLSNMESGPIGEILDPYDGKAIVGIVDAPGWDGQVVVGFDHAFVNTMIEVLLGADGSEPPVDDERGFSAVERRIAELLLEQATRALQASFAPVSDTAFKLKGAETRMDFAVGGRRDALAVVVRFQLQALERGGEMFVLIPQTALTPMRHVLSRVVSGEPAAGDPAWSRQIRGEVQKTSVSLRAILEERSIMLAEVASLKVGQVLQLQANPDSRIKLESKEQPLFWCQLGQSDGTYKLRVEDFFDQEQEFVNDLLSS